MLPAVAVRQLVPRNARVIDTRNQTAAGNAVSAAM
jgi:hypothetical protein